MLMLRGSCGSALPPPPPPLRLEAALLQEAPAARACQICKHDARAGTPRTGVDGVCVVEG